MIKFIVSFVFAVVAGILTTIGCLFNLCNDFSLIVAGVAELISDSIYVFIEYLEYKYGPFP